MITLRDLENCKVGDTVVGMLTDMHAFWQYEESRSLLRLIEDDYRLSPSLLTATLSIRACRRLMDHGGARRASNEVQGQQRPAGSKFLCRQSVFG